MMDMTNNYNQQEARYYLCHFKHLFCCTNYFAEENKSHIIPCIVIC